MKRVSHQGIQLSASQRRQLSLIKLVNPGVYRLSNAQELNERFPVSFGPYAPPVIDHERESRAYWLMAENFKRYGRLVAEESFIGAPFCGDRTLTILELE